MKMIRKLSVSVLLLSLLVFGVASAKNPSRESDPNNLVTFAVPQGWKLKDKDDGTRLRLISDPQAGGIQVNVYRVSYDAALADTKKHVLAIWKYRGFKIGPNKVGKLKGFRSWESTATMGDGLIVHNLFLYNSKYEIKLQMIAKPGVHDKRKGALAYMARSLKVR